MLPSVNLFLPLIFMDTDWHAELYLRISVTASHLYGYRLAYRMFTSLKLILPPICMDIYKNAVCLPL